VATQQIVQSFATITWLLLGGLALGSFALAWLLRQVTDASPGYLRFSGLLAALLGFLWWLTELALPAPADLAIQHAPDLDEARRLTIALFGLLALVSGVRLGRGGRALWVGAATILSGVAAMALAAWGWTGGTDLAASYLVQLLALSAVSGGALAAIVLAHWYLVTPRISARPLVLATRLLAWALGISILLFFAWQAAGIPTGVPFDALTGSNAVFGWLRLGVGLVFPLVLTWMAYRTALTRSMESATGLLYIAFAAILASTIVAAGLAFAEGVLV
jgi:hypothetical protein